jgi:hypothetical protein
VFYASESRVSGGSGNVADPKGGNASLCPESLSRFSS